VPEGAYRLEAQLVDDFVTKLQHGRTPWGDVKFVREFDFQRGKPDVVLLSKSGEVVAIEAKLTRWRDALHQATRNRSFAETSYVLLPTAAAKVAEKYLAEFRVRNVGLCSLSPCGLDVIFEPRRETPIEPWLNQAATEAASNARRPN
jgi:hypothetical protein